MDIFIGSINLSDLLIILLLTSLTLILIFWKTDRSNRSFIKALKGTTCLAMIVMILLLSLRLWFSSAFHHALEVIAESVSSDKKYKIIVQSEGFIENTGIGFYYQPISSIDFLKVWLEPNCFDFGHGQDYEIKNKISWDQNSHIFIFWDFSDNAPAPVCLYDLKNPHRSFTYLDPYYYQFNFKTNIPKKQLVHYLAGHQSDYISGFINSAAGSGDTEVLQMLIDEGISLNASGHPLKIAIIKDKTATAKFLLSKGVKISSEDSIFVLAASKEDLSLLRILLEFGADINEQDQDGETALMKVTRKENITLVKFLLSKGANKNIQSKSRETSLIYAQRWCHGDNSAEIKKLLK